MGLEEGRIGWQLGSQIIMDGTIFSIVPVSKAAGGPLPLLAILGSTAKPA